MKVYTYVSPEVRDLLTRSMESLVIACPQLKDSELVLLHRFSDPGKIVSKLLDLFKKVTLHKVDMINDRTVYDSSVGLFASYCLSKMEDFDGLYIDPTIFVMKPVDFTSFGNYFIRTNSLIISPKLFVIRSIETIRKAMLSYMTINLIALADVNLLTYVLTSNFMVNAKYNINEPLIRASDYPNSRFDEVKVISPTYVDMTCALGSNYRLIHSFVNREEPRSKSTVIDLISRFKKVSDDLVSTIADLDINFSEVGVTFIVPAYKSELYLLECVNSLVSQADKLGIKYEVLIGIDACNSTLDHVKSNDRLMSLCKIYYFPVNEGPYLIRNTLAAEAAYENLIFFDSDDIFGEGSLKITLENILSGIEVVRWKIFNFKQGERFHPKLLHISSAGAFAISKENFLKLNGFLPWRMAADTEFHLRAEWHNLSVIHSNVAHIFRRLHSTNLTIASSTGMASQARKDLHKIVESRKALNSFPNPIELVCSKYIKIN